MPGLRSRPDTAAGDGPVYAVLTPLPRMRWANPIPWRDDVPPMPEAGCARRREVAVPALRKARLSAGCDRVVWPVLPAGPGKGPASHLCQLRRVTPPRRARHVRAMLAAPPGPAVRARRDTGRSAHPTTGLARRLRRIPGRPPLPRARLRADHHAVSATGRRTPQPPAKRARAGPPTRPVNGITGTRPRNILHPARPGDGHRPGPAARRRTAQEADRRRTSRAARRCRGLRRVHAARS